MRRALIRFLLVVALGLTTMGLIPSPAAQAAVPTGPTAVAVAPNGITYVGFAAGGSLLRIDASGGVLSPVTLPRSGPVDGLAVDAAGDIWVSNGAGASKISPTGTELTFFAYRNAPNTCPSTDAADPSKYGGIAVSPTHVFVSSRCVGAVDRYTLTGTYLNGVTESGTGKIAWGPAQNGKPAKIYWSMPDLSRVFVANDDLAPGPDGPVQFQLTPLRENGWVTPQPRGVVVDKYGQLIVVDAANNAVVFYDTNNSPQYGVYDAYRTLGHPPNPGSNAGDLNLPTAIAQYPVDGPVSEMRGDLFVADAGNNRVQRWNTYGFTFWATSTTGGPSNPTAPVNTGLPTVTGTPQVGSTLTCTDGTWSGSPTSYEYGWNRNGSSISGATAKTFVPVTADAGQGVSCFVRATNAAGTSGYVTSASVTVGAANPTGAPVNTVRPVITGTAQLGSTLTCDKGTWTGTAPITYARRWHRNGTLIAGANLPTYVVQAADVGQAITCRVTATNSVGTSAATISDPVVPTGPAPSCAAGDASVSINNAATFTNSEAVSLRIVAPAGATAVSISNDGGFSGASPQALSGTCTYAWTLALSGSDRATKNVYVRFTGASDRVSDDIVLDKTSPVAAASARKISKTKTAIKLVANDSISGVAKVEFAKSKPGAGARKASYHRTYKIKTKTKAKYAFVRVYDKAGNVSRWKKVKFRR